MNSKIALSGLSILSALALMGGATFAYFNDVGTSNTNVFATGTLDLKLSDDTVETDQDSVTASFGGTNLAPSSLVLGQLRLKNAGTVNADHAEIIIANINSDTTNPLDKVMEITVLNYGGISVLTQITDSNTNGYPDLDDFEALGLDNLPLGDLGTNHPLDMTVQMRSTAGSEYQGDTLTSNWTITLNQHSSQ